MPKPRRRMRLRKSKISSAPQGQSENATDRPLARLLQVTASVTTNVAPDRHAAKASRQPANLGSCPSYMVKIESDHHRHRVPEAIALSRKVLLLSRYRAYPTR